MNAEAMTRDRDQRIAATFRDEHGRLRNFIRKHVADDRDVEDILQDVFYELVEAYHLLKPIEHASAWLFRIARNRIIDLFRRKRPEVSADDEALSLADWLPSTEGGPDASYARAVMLEALSAAFEELPAEQRDVFIAHELEGKSFKEIAAASGVNVNTLISRKHYAVVSLRRRLQELYDDFIQERG